MEQPDTPITPDPIGWQIETHYKHTYMKRDLSCDWATEAEAIHDAVLQLLNPLVKTTYLLKDGERKAGYRRSKSNKTNGVQVQLCNGPWREWVL
jgi:hypothetical protein